MVVLAELSWGEWFMVMTAIGVCALLMLIILVQRGRGEGLTGALGGGGSSAFGAKTGDVFTWITVVGTVIYLFVAVAANFALDETPSKKPPTASVKTTPVSGETIPESPAGTQGTPPSTVPVTTAPSAPSGDNEVQPSSGNAGEQKTENKPAADSALNEDPAERAPAESEPPADDADGDATEDAPGP